ncbi:hypothetical protein SMTE5_46520 [Serratia marcescens]|nr:hypothetical protein SMTE5_46520 [Serratia marcescens]
MNRIAFPFLVLPDEAIKFKGWFIGEPDGPLFLASNIFDNWDYEQDISIRAELTLDFPFIAEILGFNTSELTLAVLLTVGTGIGSMPRRIDKVATSIITQSNTNVVLEALLNGKDLSGQLRLGIQIVLDSPENSGGILSPKNRGSRLWQTHLNILLEDGGDSRFPIELASFSKRYAGKSEQSALWIVEWQPEDLQADFGGSVRLYVNSDIKSFTDSFVKGEGRILQILISDVMTQMIEIVLDLDEDENWLSTFEEGSVGYQIKSWIELVFPGHTLLNVRKLRKNFPGRFRASILAAADMGEGE